MRKLLIVVLAVVTLIYIFNPHLIYSFQKETEKNFQLGQKKISDQLPEFQEKLDDIVALEKEATAAEMIYSEAYDKLADLLAYEEREVIIQTELIPLIEEGEDEEIDDQEEKPSKALILSQTFQKKAPSISIKKTVSDKGILSGLQAKIIHQKSEVAKHQQALKELDDQLDEKYDDIWGMIPFPSPQFNAIYAEVLLASIYHSTLTRRDIGMPLSSLFPGDPDCVGDIIADELNFNYIHHLLNALKAKDKVVINDEKGEALKYLSSIVRQFICMSSLEMILVDFFWADNFYIVEEKLDEVGAPQLVKDLFLGVLLNPFVLSFEANSFHGSAMFELVKNNDERLKGFLKPGFPTYEIGFWLRNWATGEIVLQNFDLSADPTKVETSPLANLSQDIDLLDISMLTTPFGVPLDKMQEVCKTIRAAPQNFQPKEIGWGQAVKNMTDPMQLGMGGSGFANSIMQNVPDVRTGCVGGGQGGTADYSKFIACAMAQMDAWKPNVKKCIPGPNVLQPRPKAAYGRVMGGSGGGSARGGPAVHDMTGKKPKLGDSADPFDVAYKVASGADCGGGLSQEAESDSESPEAKKKKPKKDKDDKKTEEEKEKKALEAYKNQARETYKKYRGKMMQMLAKIKGGALTTGEMKAIDAAVETAIENSTMANLPDNFGEQTAAEYSVLTDENGNYQTGTARVIWHKPFVMNPDEKRDARFQMHELNGHGGLYTQFGDKYSGGQHHKHQINAGLYRCGADDSCSGACTGSQLQAQVFLKCAGPLQLGGLQQGCELMGPGCDPKTPIDPPDGGPFGTAGIEGSSTEGSVGYTPMGPDYSELPLKCDLAGAAIDMSMLPHFGIYDPSPIETKIKEMRMVQERVEMLPRTKLTNEIKNNTPAWIPSFRRGRFDRGRNSRGEPR